MSQTSCNHILRCVCNCIFNWNSFWKQSDRNCIWPIKTTPTPCRLFWKWNIDNVPKIQMQREIQWYNCKRISFIWIPRRSARLKRLLASTTSIEITNQFSSLINSWTPTAHAIRNLNDSNIQDDLSLIKKPSRTSKNTDDSNILSISEKQPSPSENSVLEKGLSFCSKTPGYNKLKLMVDLFCFCRNIQEKTGKNGYVQTINSANIFHQ